MIVTIEQIQAGIIKYIDMELGAKAVGVTKFMIYFFAPSIPKKVVSKLESFREADVNHEFFTEDGGVNLDEVYKRAKSAIERSGKLLIPQIDYFVDTTDVDKLYNLIKNS